MNRREAIRSLSIAAGASLLPSTPSLAAVLGKSDVSYAQAVKGTAPVGLMVCGPAMSDRRILAVAAAVERALSGD